MTIMLSASEIFWAGFIAGVIAATIIICAYAVHLSRKSKHRQ